jgi:hypothetical protein
MSFSNFVLKVSFVAMIAFASCAIAAGAHAESSVEIALSYKDKKFDPPQISAPANTPIVIKFRNLDKDATIKVRAQKPGRYEFFDEYNEKTARGALVVK